MDTGVRDSKLHSLRLILSNLMIYVAKIYQGMTFHVVIVILCRM